MNRLRAWRIDRNLSQYDLSAVTGIPRWRIQLLESAIQIPNKDEVENLAQALGLKPEDIFMAHPEAK